MASKEFLADLARELRTQDNRSTAAPLFLVQEQKRIYGVDSGYSDESEWIDSDCEVCGDTEFVRETIREEKGLEGVTAGLIDPAEHGYARVYYTKYWDFVTAHFTERAAQLYIDQNRHNLNLPRVYVSSQYRCTEWNEVVEHLKAGPCSG